VSNSHISSAQTSLITSNRWWPSLEHVFCDRVVKSLDEVVTPGKNSVFWVLPMLTGTEEDGPTVGTYKFMREGPERDMHNVLMVAASKKIRVLRGHTLKSNYAPTAGIRCKTTLKISVEWLLTMT
jgi:hypothetical protein